MDPVTATTTFAALVGLVCDFRQEKGDREALDHQKFVEWLEYHRHEELKNLIINTAALGTEVDNLLRSDHSQMLQKLDQIGKILISLLSRLDDFRGLALAIAPNAELSEQAVSILRQFVNSGDNDLHYDGRGGQFTLQFRNGGQIEVTEPRFIEDDLNQLAALHLVSVDYNSQGNLYGINRNAVRFIETIDGKRTS